MPKIIGRCFLLIVASRAMTHKGADPSWERMWGAGLRKGAAFDVGGVSPALKRELRDLPRPSPGSSRALVPGFREPARKNHTFGYSRESVFQLVLR